MHPLSPTARTRVAAAVPRMATARLLRHLITLTLLVPSVAWSTPWGYLVSPDGKTRRALNKSTMVIGSGRGADVVIPAATVSKRHISIRNDRGLVWVKDLGSRLGTLVAGTALPRGKSMQLFRRTKLTLGAVTWTFEWGRRGKIIAPLRKPKRTPKAQKPGKVTKTKRVRHQAKARARQRKR